jgi:S-adenosylmethionine:tRNA-ribosyltransferase-isomerase (queuine synthetase)
MHVSELDYDLPPELIAQQPAEPRDASRLLVCDRATRTYAHRRFYELPEFLRPGDLLVANDTSVINARLRGRKPSGGKAELLLLRKLDEQTWEALVGGRNVAQILFDLPEGKLSAEVVGQAGEATFVVRFSAPIEPYLDLLGEAPAAAVHPRAPARPKPLPDGLCAGGRLGCRADRRLALHPPIARAHPGDGHRRGVRHAARRAGHV